MTKTDNSQTKRVGGRPLKGDAPMSAAQRQRDSRARRVQAMGAVADGIVFQGCVPPDTSASALVDALDQAVKSLARPPESRTSHDTARTILRGVLDELARRHLQTP